MQIRAAIQWEVAQPLVVQDAELAPPGSGEVLVEMQAAGVCHSDLHPARGHWPIGRRSVLGHEGAGIVREVGPGVTSRRARGSCRLVLGAAVRRVPAVPRRPRGALRSTRKITYRNKLPSGAARLHARGKDIAPFLGTACFSSSVVVPEEAVIRARRTCRSTRWLPWDAQCSPASARSPMPPRCRQARVAVIGAGGIGLNVIQGAVIAGSEQIFAIDVRPAPLALARQFGATQTIESPPARPPALRELTGGRGVDFAFDTVGSSATLAALAATRKGGTVVLTGLSRADSQAAFPMFPFVMQEKRLLGSVYGSGNPLHDIPAADRASIRTAG